MSVSERVEAPNPLEEGLRRRRTPEPCALTIFGASGDLTQRKLFPALYALAIRDLLPPTFGVVGVGGLVAFLLGSLFLFDAAGMKFVLLMTVLLAPASLLYVKARSEHARRIFTPAEIGLFALIVAGGVIGAVGLWTGRITL